MVMIIILTVMKTHIVMKLSTMAMIIMTVIIITIMVMEEMIVMVMMTMRMKTKSMTVMKTMIVMKVRALMIITGLLRSPGSAWQITGSSQTASSPSPQTTGGLARKKSSQ